MRKIFLFFSLFFTFLLAEKTLEDLYLEGGIDAVAKKIEKNLQDENYWKKRFEKMDLKYGYYDEKIILISVNKSKSFLNMFEYEDGILTPKFSQKVLVGKSGDKMREGDLKTPVGVYEITKRFNPTDEYYGPVAFILSYPNLLDLKSGKNGGGIWIHGYPISGNLREDTFNTRGCVALTNDLLLDFESIVMDKGGLTLIDETNSTTSTNDEIAAIFAQIFEWKHAWQVSDFDKYIGFYASDFSRYDGMNFEIFKQNKRQIFSRKEHKFIQFSKFSITPYPNVKNQRLFRVNFLEKYRAGGYKFDGYKTLYVRLNDKNKMQIIVEQ